MKKRVLGFCVAALSFVLNTPMAIAVALQKEGQQADKSIGQNQLRSLRMDESQGCLQGANKQFGRYLGDWIIENWTLQSDGKSWLKQPDARWKFICFGNGVAIQDIWMPANGKSGTNLRTYNAKTESWDIAWAVTGVPGMAQIGAKQDAAGNMVMRYVSPKPNPPQRITFRAPTNAGWDWELQQSFDNEKTWITVYKIKASPRMK